MNRPEDFRLLSVSHIHEGYVHLLIHDIRVVPPVTQRFVISIKDGQAAAQNLISMLFADATFSEPS